MSGHAAQPGPTQRLCGFLDRFGLHELPESAVHAARRGVLDWLGCALAGSAAPASATLFDLLASLGPGRAVTVLGRKTKLGLIDAAMANGVAAHALDYDDTRGSAPILAAVMALADNADSDGGAIIAAYAAGIEVGERIGQAAPGHHRAGWHPIGTVGTIAAAAAAAKMLRLDAARLAQAIGLAATQAAGLQRNRGTAAKPFHAGKAASNGLLAALLAQRGFDCAPDALDGPLGFCQVYSDEAATEAIAAGLGESWAIGRNGYKPYPCGLVFHPIIDAMIDLRARFSLPPAAVTAIELRCHPIVAAIGANAQPETGSAAKFSAAHAASIALVDGRAGLGQFTDARARAPDIAAMRHRVTLARDDACRMDQVSVRASADGRDYEAIVAHALGSPENPMSDAALEAKFIDNAETVIGIDRARQVAALIWRLETLDSTKALSDLCA